jgi:dTDP-glucose pyrophosphorylase
MNIVIPIAGDGLRFASAGYKNPKPFIDIDSKMMIIRVIENIGIMDAKYIFLCQKKHLADFGALFIKQLESTLNDFEVIGIEGKTEGAACTVLLTKSFINNEDELIIANGDQLVGKDDIKNSVSFFSNAEAGVLCFFARDTKWSYVSISDSRQITRVAEKEPISDHATCGIYYFKRGKIFVEAAEEMITRNDRVKNEFYVAPSFNYVIKSGYRVLPYFVNIMIGLGTPEDLQIYLNSIHS